jgi:hypothetical protein
MSAIRVVFVVFLAVCGALWVQGRLGQEAKGPQAVSSKSHAAQESAITRLSNAFFDWFDRSPEPDPNQTIENGPQIPPEIVRNRREIIRHYERILRESPRNANRNQIAKYRRKIAELKAEIGDQPAIRHTNAAAK